MNLQSVRIISIVYACAQNTRRIDTASHIRHMIKIFRTQGQTLIPNLIYTNYFFKYIDLEAIRKFKLMMYYWAFLKILFWYLSPNRVLSLVSDFIIHIYIYIYIYIYIASASYGDPQVAHQKNEICKNRSDQDLGK